MATEMRNNGMRGNGSVPMGTAVEKQSTSKLWHSYELKCNAVETQMEEPLSGVRDRRAAGSGRGDAPNKTQKEDTMKGRVLQALRDRQTRWFLCWLGKWALLVFGIMLYTVVVTRAAEARQAQKFEVWKTEWIADQEAAAKAAIEADPETIRLNSEASLLARVLYGVRDNDTDDLRTYCWCVFNRVDNPAYPSTLTEVITQPGQWMRYSPDNPVLESLYNIAREQIEAWRNNGHRPVGNEYVYMAWSSDDIVLRDTWETGAKARYWRWGQ